MTDLVLVFDEAECVAFTGCPPASLADRLCFVLSYDVLGRVEANTLEVCCASHRSAWVYAFSPSNYQHFLYWLVFQVM